MREENRNAVFVVAIAALAVYLIAPSMVYSGLYEAADALASSVRFISDSVANTGLIGGSTCGSYQQTPGADPAGEDGCPDYSSMKLK